MDLTERQKVIFKTLVDQFTQVAEPIGSKTLIPLLDFPVSPATVRAELAALEKEGLLEKTHTSSGRIPSKKGYLYYVENLLETTLDPEVEKKLKSVFKSRHASVEEMIQTSCSILSEMTHLTSVVIGPDQSRQKLTKIQLIPIDEENAVAVFVTNTGHTEHRLFNFRTDVSIKDLTECTNLLNEQLAGTPVDEVTERLRQIEPLMAARITRHEVLFEAFIAAFMSMKSNEAVVSGRANMLAQPEFADASKLENLMRILENQSLFHEWTTNQNNVSVPIGEKNKLIQIGDCSVVSTEFSTAQGEQGQLMVVGPNRMPYSKVIALMDCMSRQIEDLFQHPGKGGASDEQKSIQETGGQT